jgi:hypothetical protein
MKNVEMRYIAVALVLLFAGCASRGSLAAISGDAGLPAIRAAVDDIVVQAREYKIPKNATGTTSIIVGPDNNLWFTELEHIASVTTGGSFRQVALQWPSYPGTLVVGPDGNVWANAAGNRPPHRKGDRFITYYLFYRVTPSMRRTLVDLPKDALGMPSNLVRVDSQFYFAYETHRDTKNGDKWASPVGSLQTDGTVKTLFNPIYRHDSVAWLNVLWTPDKKLWLYDYSGNIRICSLDRHCKLVHEGYPYEDVGNIHAMTMAYSPIDHDVYIANLNNWTIERVSESGQVLSGYSNPLIQLGFGALAYYHGNIWITMNADAEGRPMFGRLSPSGTFTEYSLPFVGSKFAATAMVEGPDGHLWYVRGHHIGEILSNV